MNNLIDTHLHLDCYRNHSEIYEEINKLKQYTLCVTNLPEVFESCIEMYKETRYIKFAVGYNPQMIISDKFDKASFLRSVYKPKYIGEVGLDFSKQYEEYKSKQIVIFDFICKVAANENKILSIHSRKAEKEVLALLKKNKVKYAIIHWYTGNVALVKEFIKEGYYFSINPAMLRSLAGKKIINEIPMERVLVETDGPISKMNGKRMEPRNLIEIYKKINELYNIHNSNKIIYNNFKRLLNENLKI